MDDKEKLVGDKKLPFKTLVSRSLKYMKEVEQLCLFDDFTFSEKNPYKQFKIKNTRELIRFLKQFIVLREDDITPYKHKPAYYNKKAHYINGQRVNRQVYAFVKNWFEENS